MSKNSSIEKLTDQCINQAMEIKQLKAENERLREWRETTLDVLQYIDCIQCSPCIENQGYKCVLQKLLADSEG